MSDKIDDIQKQLDTLNHMLLKVQADLDNEKAKAKTAAKDKEIFCYLDEGSSLECYSDAVANFSSEGGEFSIRCSGKYKDKGFYLGDGRASEYPECPWEIVLDDEDAWVLILKEIK